MSETKKINECAVLSALLDNSHLLLTDAGGTVSRLSPAGMGNYINKHISLTKESANLVIKKGDWIRIAQGPYTQSPFGAVLNVCHYYESGTPMNLIVAVCGCGWTVESFNANVLVGWNNPSFDAIRLVKESDNTVFIEVRFAKTKTQRIYVSRSAHFRLELVDAAVSTATADKVIKTIDLLGGVKRGYSIVYDLDAKSVRKGGAHERDKDATGPDEVNAVSGHCGLDVNTGRGLVRGVVEGASERCAHGGLRGAGGHRGHGRGRHAWTVLDRHCDGRRETSLHRHMGRIACGGFPSWHPHSSAHHRVYGAYGRKGAECGRLREQVGGLEGVPVLLEDGKGVAA